MSSRKRISETSEAPSQDSGVSDQRRTNERPYIRGEEAPRNTTAKNSRRFIRELPKATFGSEKELNDMMAKESVNKTVAMFLKTKTLEYIKLPKVGSAPSTLLDIHNYEQDCKDVTDGKNSLYVQRFCREVREYGYCAIDTEGVPASLIQLASPKGLVIYWSPIINEKKWFHEISKGQRYRSQVPYDFTTMPKQLLDLLKDEDIIKIQSDVFNDKRKLEDGGISVNSCVDLRLIYLLHSTFDGAKCGMEVIIRLAAGLPYVDGQWNILWKANLIQNNKKAMQHMCQDVRGAIVGLYAMIDEFFDKDKTDNMMPFIQQLLFTYLDIDKDPQTFNNPESILSPNTHGEGSFRVHPLKTVHFFMDTSPYFVEAKDFIVKRELMPRRPSITSQEDRCSQEESQILYRLFGTKRTLLAGIT